MRRTVRSIHPLHCVLSKMFPGTLPPSILLPHDHTERAQYSAVPVTVRPSTLPVPFQSNPPCHYILLLLLLLPGAGREIDFLHAEATAWRVSLQCSPKRGRTSIHPASSSREGCFASLLWYMYTESTFPNPHLAPELTDGFPHFLRGGFKVFVFVERALAVIQSSASSATAPVRRPSGLSGASRTAYSGLDKF